MKINKINKIILRILQFLGILKDVRHIDDIKIILDDTYLFAFGTIDYINIKTEIFKRFESDKKLKGNCIVVEQVKVLIGMEFHTFIYLDDMLFYVKCKEDVELLNRKRNEI